MLDFRIETFLTLCDTKSYTKTAALLCVTQPTVTQHIKYLEKQYDSCLFSYSGKTLRLTVKGEQLRHFALSMRVNSYKIEEAMKTEKDTPKQLCLGATRTIGEYVLPPLIAQYLTIYPNRTLKLLVNNTKNLLDHLREGSLDFAIIEGNFSRTSYDYSLFSKEQFIGVCSKDHPLSNQTVTFEQLLSERLIMREPGSGTRDILELVLKEHNLEPNDFASYLEFDNFQTIKHLITRNLGITFVYSKVVEEDLAQGNLCILDVADFDLSRAFHFVYLKHSLFEKEYHEFFQFCRNTYSTNKKDTPSLY